MARVARQVVDDDDVARRERRHEDLSHVLQEARAIDGAVEELGGGHAAQPQPGNERGLLAVPVRDRRAQAHASRRAAVQASHGGGGKALVDEHELRRIEIELGFEPVLTSLHPVGAVLLGSVQGLLFEGQAAAIEDGPDRAGAGTHAVLRDEPALQFFDGGVRCGLDHRPQEVAMGVELGAGPASLPACRTLAAVAQTLDPLDRRRNADVEANRGLARRRPVSRGLNHSVASATEGDRKATAEAAFQGALSQQARNAAPPQSPTFQVSGSGTDDVKVTGEAAAGATNPFGGLIGGGTIDFKVAAAAKKGVFDPICVMALNKTDNGAMDLNGTVNVTTNCPAQANSSDSSAVRAMGNARMNTSVFAVTGDVKGKDAFSPMPETRAPRVAAPLASVPFPLKGSCHPLSNAKIQNNTTLTPGTYCGGLDISSGAVVTMEPGIYIFADDGAPRRREEGIM